MFVVNYRFEYIYTDETFHKKYVIIFRIFYLKLHYNDENISNGFFGRTEISNINYMISPPIMVHLIKYFIEAQPRKMQQDVT